MTKVTIKAHTRNGVKVKAHTRNVPHSNTFLGDKTMFRLNHSGIGKAVNIAGDKVVRSVRNGAMKLANKLRERLER